ncbi:MAG: hypothetical protein IPN05_19930 [Sulfuritalea sp.]|nr:hypothetical protein [Sulfuritalea sp.]
MSRSTVGASGGNFESPAGSTVAATTSISDTTDATTVSPTASLERGRRRQHHPHREPGAAGRRARCC